jgi:hypothetical protein
MPGAAFSPTAHLCRAARGLATRVNLLPDAVFDFGRTRTGHALFDIAYLETSLPGRVLSPSLASDDESLSLLERDDYPQRAGVHAVVRDCLFGAARLSRSGQNAQFR